MSKRDYYAVLGVEKNASDRDLKRAYKRLAMKFHPDRNQSDESAKEKFQEAKEAYEILSNQQKRAAYDQFGHAGVDPSAGGQAGGAGFGDVFEDIFGDIFGGGRSRGGQANQAHRGSDLQYNLELTLEEAVFGTRVDIRIPTQVNCDVCHGSGAKKGTQAETCGTCHGQGQVRMQQGFFTVQQACPHCQGTGKRIKEPCSACHGQGRKEEHKTLSVKIPMGVDTGDRIRLSGEGEAGLHGGPGGDLYVQVHVKMHPLFKRDGSDLYCEAPISFTTAALGGEFEIPTLDGKVKLKIPAETQTGKLFRLRNKGVKSIRDATLGDLMCRVVVETPVNLNTEQKKILESLESTMHAGGKRHRPQEHGWVDKAKTFLDDVKGWVAQKK